MSKGKKKKPSRRIYTDRDGYPVDRDGNRINIKETDTPMYRAYGKHRVYRPWIERIGDILYKILVLAVTVPMYAVAIAAVIAVFYYMRIYPSLGIIGFSFLIWGAVVFYIRALRIPRKRIGYYSKLKRFCRKKGYKLEIKRNRIMSLLPSRKAAVDLIIRTEGLTYYVKFISAAHKHSELTFYPDGRAVYLSLEEKRGISHMLGTQNKKKTRHISFPEEAGGDRAIRAVVTCPDPKKIYKGISDEERLLYSGRDTVGGYKVFSSDGFMYAVEHDKRAEIENFLT